MVTGLPGSPGPQGSFGVAGPQGARGPQGMQSYLLLDAIFSLIPHQVLLDLLGYLEQQD